MTKNEARRKLLKLLNNDTASVDDIDKMIKEYHDKYQTEPRKEYLPPEDRSTYNYGYATDPETDITGII